MCEPLTRRQLVRYGALLAATFPASKLPGFSLGETARASGPAVPMNLELVTVTDTEAAITWFTGDPTTLDAFNRPSPVAAPGRVLIGTSPDPSSWVETGAHGPTAYHYVELRGLRPGTTYYWRAESNGLPAIPTVLPLPNGLTGAAPASFTTMVPPPGKEIGRVAWINDLHIGESTSGLAYSNSSIPGGGLPPGFAVDPAHPYWRFMSQAAVTEAKARGCTLMLVNGDVSSEARPNEVGEARATLNRFGTLAGARHVSPGSAPVYFVTRGNHDRLHGGKEYDRCSKKGDLNDCFGDAFAASYDPGTTHFSVSMGNAKARYRFVGLDSNDSAGSGVMPKAELDYLEAQLALGDVTIPLFHHPVSDIGVLTDVPPVTFGVNPQDARALRAVLAKHANVGGVYNGHTHRNNRSLASDTGTIPYFEGGATKEYPGGYTVVRLYETGYLVNFWKTAAPECRAWSERSRGEYLGLYPYYTLGGLGDRNWSYDIDARTHHRPAARAAR